jgi:hypothetical protein
MTLVIYVNQEQSNDQSNSSFATSNCSLPGITQNIDRHLKKGLVHHISHTILPPPTPDLLPPLHLLLTTLLLHT